MVYLCVDMVNAEPETHQQMDVIEMPTEAPVEATEAPVEATQAPAA